MLSEEIAQKFKTVFSKTPLMVRSPGRINLIGEHTDYNNGFVLPAAIDKEITCAISVNYKNTCRVISHDLDEEYDFDLHDLKKSDLGWPNYIMGVVEQFQKRGLDIKGFDCVFGGDIPLGAGLSSSAALECAFAFSFNTLFDFGLEKFELVKLAQKAENEFVGVQCGIMDQFASVFGKSDKVMRLDCQSLDFEYFDFDLTEYRVVLCDSQVKHSLASSEYNTRRKECETGVAILEKHYPEVKSLRDVKLEQLEAHKAEFNPVVYQRCTYVVEENDRVLDSCQKLNNGDLPGFGQNMFKSHDGLSRKYEVSCKELDFLVEKAKATGEIIGARMMGGGFGGCTINLVKIDRIDHFISAMTEAYKKELDLELKCYVVKIENGTGKI